MESYLESLVHTKLYNTPTLNTQIYLSKTWDIGSRFDPKDIHLLVQHPNKLNLQVKLQQNNP